jgi:hypothetical protein
VSVLYILVYQNAPQFPVTANHGLLTSFKFLYRGSDVVRFVQDDSVNGHSFLLVFPVVVPKGRNPDANQRLTIVEGNNMLRSYSKQ